MSFSSQRGSIKVLLNSELEYLVARYDTLDFASYWGSNRWSSGDINRATAQVLKRSAQSAAGSCYSTSELGELFRRIKSQSVVINAQRYDPDLRMGMCFARALVTHTQSLLMKPQVPVLKIWHVGSMQTSGMVKDQYKTIHWGFHVSTLVLGCDQNWYTLDTLFPDRPYSAGQWISNVRVKFKASGQNMIFISSPTRYAATAGSTYSSEWLGAKGYSGYFKDYLQQNPGISR